MISYQPVLPSFRWKLGKPKLSPRYSEADLLLIDWTKWLSTAILYASSSPFMGLWSSNSSRKRPIPQWSSRCPYQIHYLKVQNEWLCFPPRLTPPYHCSSASDDFIFRTHKKSRISGVCTSLFWSWTLEGGWRARGAGDGDKFEGARRGAFRHADQHGQSGSDIPVSRSPPWS